MSSSERLASSHSDSLPDRPVCKGMKEEPLMSTGTASQMYTYFRVFDGVRVRFADTKADSDTTVLMLAPWPESLWAFRRIWDRITSLGRVVAIDMPGFGHSDQPP